MTSHDRALARFGATVLFAGTVLLAAATPALAADIDFGIELTGTTIAANASGKFGRVAVKNLGTTTPTTIKIKFDASQLDDAKVKLLDTCEPENDVAVCVLDDEGTPSPGVTTELIIPLEKQAGATGAAGKLTVSVLAEGDSVAANNSRTVDVTVGGSGVDLGVIAGDVTASSEAKPGFPDGEPVEPGDVAPFFGSVINAGDRAAVGLLVELQLPEQVTFAEVEEDCEYSADNRFAACEYDDLTLVPFDESEESEEETFGVSFFFPVRLSADAEGPGALGGGLLTVTALAEEAPEAVPAAARRAALPDNVRPLTAAEVADVDPTDNADDFAVLVAGPDGGQGGGGGLPITGPATAVLGGGGLAVAALGTLLLLAARRRRLVLVAPGDGR